MTRHWRSLGFVPLALLLVLVVHDLSVNKRAVPLDQVGAGLMPRPKVVRPSVEPAERLLAGSVTEIPLYEGGDLPAHPAAKKKAVKPRPLPRMKPPPVESAPVKPVARRKMRPPTREKQVQAKAAVMSPAPIMDQVGSEKASRPVLVASYDGIGFARYLEVVERVGRFFVLLRLEGGTKIGPPVSLAQRLTIPYSQSPTAGLATERPHLVSDRDVRRRLREMRLPRHAFEDRVALLFRDGFDQELWAAVGDALRRRQLTLSQVEEVRGHYVFRSGIIHLEFDNAQLKNDGGYVLLSEAIKVKL
jgi:hypothetical protein